MAVVLKKIAISFNNISLSAVLFSVAFHALLLLLIRETKPVPVIVKNTEVKAIQSYLYELPKPIDKEIVKLEEQPLKKQQGNKKVKINKPVKREKSQNNKPKTVVNDIHSDNTEISVSPEISAEKTIQNNTKIKKQTKTTHYPQQQLDRLRSQQYQQHIKQQVAQYSRKKTGSIMHGTPIPAPKSKSKLSIEQKKQMNTTQYSNSLAIRKNSNGSCTIKRDLSSVGIEGVTAISLMPCGESKHQKDYRLHMDKVLKKLGKK